MQVLAQNTFNAGFELKVEGETVLEANRAEYHDADEWRVTVDWATTDQNPKQRVIKLEMRGEDQWILRGDYTAEKTVK